jgi:pimeloyl-[acyl-carrier protein] synthase
VSYPEEEPPTLVELFQPRWLSDPYPFYTDLRENYPVYYDEVLRSWVITRYDDIVALARDDRLSEDRVTPFQARLSPARQAAMRPLADLLRNMMLLMNGERHTQAREMASGGFSRRAIGALRDSIRENTAVLCDEILPTGEMDVIADLSAPLTKSVIAQVLGLPTEYQDLLDDWQSLLHAYFTHSEAAVARLGRLREMFYDLTKRGVPADPPGLLGHMIALRCDPDVIFANFLLIIDAGQVTTTHLIPNAVRALLQFPDQLELLTARPDLTGPAAHELMRFDSSVQFTTRTALTEIDFRGHAIRRDEQVTLLLGSGNRDDRRFADPDRLDVTRNARGHLSFGHGRHYCLGAALALAEMEMVIGALLSRTRDLRITAPELRWQESINFRFLMELPVSFGVRGAYDADVP